TRRAERGVVGVQAREVQAARSRGEADDAGLAGSVVLQQGVRADDSPVGVDGEFGDALAARLWTGRIRRTALGDERVAVFVLGETAGVEATRLHEVDVHGRVRWVPVVERVGVHARVGTVPREVLARAHC